MSMHVCIEVHITYPYLDLHTVFPTYLYIYRCLSESVKLVPSILSLCVLERLNPGGPATDTAESSRVGAACGISTWSVHQVTGMRMTVC